MFHNRHYLVFLTCGFSGIIEAMDGLTIAEIAEKLGIKPGTAKVRLQRAGIKPQSYAGPTAVYAPEALEAIRATPGPGRPRKPH